MNKSKLKAELLLIMLILTIVINYNVIIVNSSFSDVNFEKPHYDYSEIAPSFFVNSTPEQKWKKTDVDFSGSIGKSGEFSIELSKSFNLKGKMPGKLAAVEGALEFGLKLGFRYNVSFGYIFGVDYYRWANDMAVSEGDEFNYMVYVEPDSNKFDLWADIYIEPFLSLWGNFKTYLELGGYEIVDWEQSWSVDESIPFKIMPDLNLKSFLESGLLTPIGELYSTPQIGLGLELPSRVDFDVGYLNFYFDFGVGAYVQFQLKGLVENLIKISGDSSATFDGNRL
ncbi:MAG: hypothetical protein ACTSRP_10290 [Candidatus Helarchaeota archaeon]